MSNQDPKEPSESVVVYTPNANCNLKFHSDYIPTIYLVTSMLR